MHTPQIQAKTWSACCSRGTCTIITMMSITFACTCSTIANEMYLSAGGHLKQACITPSSTEVFMSFCASRPTAGMSRVP